MTNPHPLVIILFAADNRWQCPGVAQFGSALEWGSRGREFDSRHSDQNPSTERSGDFSFVYAGLRAHIYDKKDYFITDFQAVLQMTLPSRNEYGMNRQKMRV